MWGGCAFARLGERWLSICEVGREEAGYDCHRSQYPRTNKATSRLTSQTYPATSRPTLQIYCHLSPHLANIKPPPAAPLKCFATQAATPKASLDATFNTYVNVEAVAGRRQSLSWRCPRLFAVTPALLCARPLNKKTSNRSNRVSAASEGCAKM